MSSMETTSANSLRTLYKGRLILGLTISGTTTLINGLTSDVIEYIEFHARSCLQCSTFKDYSPHCALQELEQCCPFSFVNSGSPTAEVTVKYDGDGVMCAWRLIARFHEATIFK